MKLSSQVTTVLLNAALKRRGLLTQKGNITGDGAKVARRILREQRRQSPE